jgi:hypothetical protein
MDGLRGIDEHMSMINNVYAYMRMYMYVYVYV